MEKSLLTCGTLLRLSVSASAELSQVYLLEVMSGAEYVMSKGHKVLILILCKYNDLLPTLA